MSSNFNEIWMLKMKSRPLFFNKQNELTPPSSVNTIGSHGLAKRAELYPGDRVNTLFCESKTAFRGGFFMSVQMLNMF
ncbi:hypothetical protein C8K63_104137 [Pseudomonas sp. GV085]|nr:hypothetical protein C8K63_104137 [Pseudomonas sp. GV085]